LIFVFLQKIEGNHQSLWSILAAGLSRRRLFSFSTGAAHTSGGLWISKTWLSIHWPELHRLISIYGYIGSNW